MITKQQKEKTKVVGIRESTYKRLIAFIKTFEFPPDQVDVITRAVDLLIDCSEKRDEVEGRK